MSISLVTQTGGTVTAANDGLVYRALSGEDVILSDNANFVSISGRTITINSLWILGCGRVVHIANEQVTAPSGIAGAYHLIVKISPMASSDSKRAELLAIPSAEYMSKANINLNENDQYYVTLGNLAISSSGSISFTRTIKTIVELHADEDLIRKLENLQKDVEVLASKIGSSEENSDAINSLFGMVSKLNSDIEDINKKLDEVPANITASDVYALDRLNSNKQSNVQSVLDNIADVISDNDNIPVSVNTPSLKAKYYDSEIKLIKGTEIPVLEKFNEDYIEHLVVPCSTGDKINVFFENSQGYTYGEILFCDYDFSLHAYGQGTSTELNKGVSVLASITDEQIKNGYSQLLGKRFTVPSGRGFDVTAALIPYKSSNEHLLFDYSGEYIIVKGDSVEVLTKNRISTVTTTKWEKTGGPVSLPVQVDTNYEIVDKKARSITDRISFDENNELLLNNKYIDVFTDKHATPGIVLIDGTKANVYGIVKSAGHEYLIVPCSAGETLSVFYENSNDYAYGIIGFLDYDFSSDSSSSLKPRSSINLRDAEHIWCDATDDEMENGYSSIMGCKFTVPIDTTLKINAAIISYKANVSNDSFDYSGAYLVAKGNSVKALKNIQISALSMRKHNGDVPLNVTYEIVDKRARSITDRLAIDDSGNLLFDGKQILLGTLS